MGDVYVSEQACGRTHEAIKEDLKRNEKRLNSHSEEIQTVNEAVIKLTMLLEAQDKRITALENQKTSTPPFWASDTGKFIIKGGFILACIIVLAALGQAVNPEAISKLF